MSGNTTEEGINLLLHQDLSRTVNARSMIPVEGSVPLPPDVIPSRVKALTENATVTEVLRFGVLDLALHLDEVRGWDQYGKLPKPCRFWRGRGIIWTLG